MRALKEIVIDYCAEAGIPSSDERWMRYYQIAVNGHFELERQVDTSDRHLKYEWVVPDEKGVFPMPPDYNGYEVVGVCHNGQVKAFVSKSNACPPDVSACSNYVRQDFPAGYSVWMESDAHGNFLGSSLMTNGYVQEFFELGYIAVYGALFTPEKILLMYKGEPSTVDGDYLVAPEAEVAIKAWIDMTLVVRNHRSTSAARNDYTRIWQAAKRLVRLERSRFSIIDIIDAFK